MVGIDLHPSGLDHPRFRDYLLDVRAPQIARHLQRIDAVVHLAFLRLSGAPGRKRARRRLMQDVNRGGSANLFSCARAQGVERLVYLSSASVYGYWADNPPQIGEDQPLRPPPGFAFAQDHAAVEQWLDAFEAQAPRCAVTRLRIAPLLGRHSPSPLRTLLDQPLRPRRSRPGAPIQCIWEDDVVDAIVAALFSSARGRFNLATEPALPLGELQRLHRALGVAAPAPLLRGARRLGWRLAGGGEEPGWLDGLLAGQVLDCGRARRELGWSPRLNSYDCLDHLKGKRR